MTYKGKRGSQRAWKWLYGIPAALAVAVLSSCYGEQEVIVTPELLAEPIGDVRGDMPQPVQEHETGEEAGDVQETQSAQEAAWQAFTICAVGDCSLGNHADQDYGWSFRQMYDSQANPAYFFENVYPILSADHMTIANLEGVLTTSQARVEGQTYSIKGDPSYVDILTRGSVETVGMANNHRLDYGEEGTADTVAALEGAGIVYAYDHQVGIYEKNGIRVGFVSVNEVNWGAGCEKLIQDGIESLRSRNADLILVCCHWGTERMEEPEEYQRVLGRKCVDWGADLVIGHHPHVLQGIELYKGKYILYSLANFCFGANRNPQDKDTVIFRQTFYFQEGVLQEELEADIIPCKISSVDSRNDYRPTPAQGGEKERILQRMAQASTGMGIVIDGEGRISPGG